MTSLHYIRLVLIQFLSWNVTPRLHVKKVSGGGEKENDSVINATPHPILYESHLNHMEGQETHLCHQHRLLIRL